MALTTTLVVSAAAAVTSAEEPDAAGPTEPEDAAATDALAEAGDVPRGVSTGPDFDGDGYADLAVGAPHARAGRVAAGEVHVFYGSAQRLDRERRQVLSQRSPGIAGRPEAGDQFGWSLSSGDFDGDGFSDLAVGARFEDRGARDAGVVHVLYGSSDGLRADGSQLWSQASPGIPGEPERGDQFGWSLASGDFDGDGDDELVIGTHHEDLRRPDVGVVHVLRGTPDGLTARGNQLWTQASSGVADRPEADDQFGRTLAVADFDGDDFADLAIGAPYETRRVDRAGVVHVLYGSPRGLRGRRAQYWHQDAPGIAERAEERDQFGQSLAAADFDGDGFADLAIGVWFEDYQNELSNEGGLHVIYGSARGLQATRDQFWHQDRPGTSDRTHPSDRFGQVLTVGDFDGDRRDDLVVGLPSSDLGRGIHQNRGAVHFFPGSRSGLTAKGDEYLTQQSPGVKDRPEKHDHFGVALGAADFDGDGYTDLVVGVPHEDRDLRDDGAVYVLHGSADGLDRDRDYILQLDPDRRSRADRKDAHFGWSLSGERSHSGVPRTADPDV